MVALGVQVTWHRDQHGCRKGMLDIPAPADQLPETQPLRIERCSQGGCNNPMVLPCCD